MTVMSDSWIIEQNKQPLYKIYDQNGVPNGLYIWKVNPVDKYYIDNWDDENKRCRFLGQPYAVPIGEGEYPFTPMIENFQENPVRYVHRVTGEGRTTVTQEELPHYKKVISYGVTSFGYDVRLTNDINEIKIFSNILSPEINPKKITEANFATPVIRVDEEGSEYVLIPPHSYLQAPTVEYFRIPKDILVIVLGKSTYARSALICNSTPVEPEFEGNVVIEIANVSSSPVRCYLNEGIAQFCFIKGNEACRLSYKDKAGKYQGQTGLTFAKV